MPFDLSPFQLNSLNNFLGDNSSVRNDDIDRFIRDWIGSNPPPNGQAYDIIYTYDESWNITAADAVLIPAPYIA